MPAKKSPTQKRSPIQRMIDSLIVIGILLGVQVGAEPMVAGQVRLASGAKELGIEPCQTTAVAPDSKPQRTQYEYCQAYYRPNRMARYIISNPQPFHNQVEEVES